MEGREDQRDRRSGGRREIEWRSWGDGVGGAGNECGEIGREASDEEGTGEDGRDDEGESDVGSFESRLGKSRCWIQYEVPPTTIGTCFLLCVSSIYATHNVSIT